MKIPFQKLLEYMNAVPAEYRDKAELQIKYFGGIGIYGIITYPVSEYRESYHNFILVHDEYISTESMKTDVMEVFCQDQ